MLAQKVLMVRPAKFYSNPETQATNAFQNVNSELDGEEAMIEFDRLVELLESHHMDVSVLQSSVADSPDAIFPNNWFATFPNGDVITFPMLAESRRREREPALIEDIIDLGGYERIGLEYLEEQDPPSILEGTGSLVLDHELRIGFAALSARTSVEAIEQFEVETGYQIYRFNATDPTGQPIYHTNVMMTLGNGFATVGLETVMPSERSALLQTLTESGREVIPLSNHQIFEEFAGNMIQVSNTRNERLLVMSQAARNGLMNEQIERLRLYNDHLIASDVKTIEALGGGSVRCMIAELY